MIPAIMPTGSALRAHDHRTQLYCQICRGCKRAFYVRQECCLPLGSYCDRCIIVDNPHFDHHFAQGVDR